ncbi:hypothetical protein Tcan_14962 [Toxocara canis]|uniref:Uncharacterized protein n=1 Tax=Toxocara canis TaxID=6265 RepID=A0A0B2UZX8_TOXCA|nr:hypothetical protein Tcan_14962 [Toxocara canis]
MRHYQHQLTMRDGKVSQKCGGTETRAVDSEIAVVSTSSMCFSFDLKNFAVEKKDAWHSPQPAPAGNTAHPSPHPSSGTDQAELGWRLVSNAETELFTPESACISSTVMPGSPARKDIAAFVLGCKAAEGEFVHHPTNVNLSAHSSGISNSSLAKTPGAATVNNELRMEGWRKMVRANIFKYQLHRKVQSEHERFLLKIGLKNTEDVFDGLLWYHPDFNAEEVSDVLEWEIPEPSRDHDSWSMRDYMNSVERRLDAALHKVEIRSKEEAKESEVLLRDPTLERRKAKLETLSRSTLRGLCLYFTIKKARVIHVEEVTSCLGFVKLQSGKEDLEGQLKILCKLAPQHVYLKSFLGECYVEFRSNDYKDLEGQLKIVCELAPQHFLESATLSSDQTTIRLLDMWLLLLTLRCYLCFAVLGVQLFSGPDLHW